jgi:3D (Asp-Asp-Asp) domain-containing protein
MNRSTFLGSAASVLLIVSVISYSKTLFQQQNPKPVKQTAQGAEVPGQQPNSPATTSQSGADLAKESKTAEPASADSSGPASSTSAAEKGGPTAPKANDNASASNTIAAAAQRYVATAYSLPGRTASGMHVARGLIAADPSILPFGTRVRIEGGQYSGEYVVADSGTAIKGRRIDVWMPSLREARHFGRRSLKLTVLTYGSRRAKSASHRRRPRRVSTAN